MLKALELILLPLEAPLIVGFTYTLKDLQRLWLLMRPLWLLDGFEVTSFYVWAVKGDAWLKYWCIAVISVLQCFFVGVASMLDIGYFQIPVVDAILRIRIIVRLR